MEKQAIKDLMYGGVLEMMRNSRYYYHSTIGREYSHWTPAGLEAMQLFFKDMTRYMREAEDAELDRRAKDLIMKELKS